MADYNVSLSGPQAQGAQVLDPVRTAVSGPTSYGGIADAVGMYANIFAAKSREKKQMDAESRKNAVIQEYINNESVYTDALSSGQWQAAQVATASRANFKKMLGAYPEYMDDLLKAKKSVYDGTETGEAQKQVEREIAMRENDKKGASEAGFTFHEGMGRDAENKTIDAFKYETRVKMEMEERRKANAEVRAQNAEGRAEESHVVAMREVKDKEEAVVQLVTMFDKNVDALSASVKDLVGNTAMPYEQKAAIHAANINRIKQGLLSVAARNPAMAAPWQKLVDDIDLTAQKMLDPKVKSESDAKLLKDRYEAILVSAKLATVEKNPELIPYIIGSQMFNDPALFTLKGHAEISGWLSGAGSGDTKHRPAPMVGTPNEKVALKSLEAAIRNIDKKQDKEAATQEAVNAANEVMKQTVQQGGSINPAQLKDLSAFYSSSAFGKLVTSGKVDMNVMQNAKQVFQVGYEPAVRSAVLQRLDEQVGEKGETLANNIDVKFNGNGVTFSKKQQSNPSSGSLTNGWIADGMRGNDINAGGHALKAAEEGLNTLIRMGAHMEGTTDYGKYWEANKHYLMPGYFLKDTKEGTVKNGYKFLGGDARNEKNWEKVKKDGE